MVHGSYGNNSKVPRRAVVVNVFQDGTKSDSDEALLTGVPAVPKGQKIEVRTYKCVIVESQTNILS